MSSRTDMLVVGFDSAWTAGKSGAIAAVGRLAHGGFAELGLPRSANFREAESMLLQWQSEQSPTATLVMLDQPTIVHNPSGQRPVESIVCSAVSVRRGGMQPANTGRTEMFGADAPVQHFLRRFGGAADPLRPPADTAVYETYPVLSLIAFGWILPDATRPTGRLPKYNPERSKTFSQADWHFVCDKAAAEFAMRGLTILAAWLRDQSSRKPRKADQDQLDACLCLLVGIHLAEGHPCLVIGNMQTGYIIVPDSAQVRQELQTRCTSTGRIPSEWLRIISTGSVRQPRAG
ncbi:MAG: DUF429 domain-containing protein [Myxococcales bacterium]|nr:DUF429 domain-containing protein [Myxococcales bacterium]